MTEVVFRSKISAEGDSGTITWPAGTLVGDSAILIIWGANVQSHTGIGWRPDFVHATISAADVTYYSAWSKLSLTASDLSTPFTYTGANFGGYLIYVTTPAGGIILIDEDNTIVPNSDIHVIPGFTKNATSSLITTILVDQTLQNNFGLHFLVPDGFADRGQVIMTWFGTSEADLASANYTNNATMTWRQLEFAKPRGVTLWEFLRKEEIVPPPSNIRPGISKSTNGAVTSFVVTDTKGASVTMALKKDPVLGNTLSFSGNPVHVSSIKWISDLLIPISTGLIP